MQKNQLRLYPSKHLDMLYPWGRKKKKKKASEVDYWVSSCNQTKRLTQSPRVRAP